LGEKIVMIRATDGWVNVNHILKIAGYKAYKGLIKTLKIKHKAFQVIQGARYSQETYFPPEIGLELCQTYDLRELAKRLNLISKRPGVAPNAWIEKKPSTLSARNGSALKDSDPIYHESLDLNVPSSPPELEDLESNSEEESLKKRSSPQSAHSRLS
jgi:hypothetical protein